MIQLASKEIPADIQKVLNDLQQQINKETSFKSKVLKAQLLWNSKGGKKGKTAFKEILKDLRDICVYVNLCNYCEQNEANDIEHIYPKSFFPEYAFDWGNYLLACKQCNSAYKLDRCHVLDDDNHIIDIARGTEPKYRTIAFLNPRAKGDNPNNYMIINMLSGHFILLPDLNKKDENKAQKTLEILQLNQRDTLIAARKSAGNYYYHRLDLLIRILNAVNIIEIENLLTPYDDCLDKSLTLQETKNDLRDSFKSHITTYQHPSVWYSIKVIESKTNLKWKKIFSQIPEALKW